MCWGKILIRHAKYLVSPTLFILPKWTDSRIDVQGVKNSHFKTKKPELWWWKNIERDAQSVESKTDKHKMNKTTEKKSWENVLLGETTWKIIIQQESRMWRWILLIFPLFLSTSQCLSLDIIVLSCSTTFNLAENLFEVKEKKKKKSVNWQVKWARQSEIYTQISFTVWRRDWWLAYIQLSSAP